MVRRWKPVLLSLFVLGMAVAVYQFLPERTLLDRSTQVADVTGWWKEDGLHEPYKWISNEVFFSHSGWWRLSKPFLYDVNHHLKTPLARLDDIVNQGEQTGQWELSPDGQWLLWLREFGDGVHGARLDGTGYHAWSLKAPRAIVWLDDGHRFVAGSADEVGRTDRAILGDVLNVSSVRSLSIEGAKAALSSAQIELVDDPGDAVVFLESDGRTLARHSTSLAPRLPVMVTSPHSVLSGFEEGEASPDGHRIAWLVRENRTPSWLARVLSWAPAFSVRPRHRSELWVSDAAGGGMREVGGIDITPNADDSEKIQHLQWLPDGKQISYVYGKALYVVPAD